MPIEPEALQQLLDLRVFPRLGLQPAEDLSNSFSFWWMFSASSAFNQPSFPRFRANAWAVVRRPAATASPTRADKWVFTAAPIIVMVPALITFAVIPFGPVVHLFGRDEPLWITDVNVGRFSSATAVYDQTGKHNMAITYVRLALGEPVDLREVYDVDEDHYVLRDVDMPPAVFHADDFFDGIEEARA